MAKTFAKGLMLIEALALSDRPRGVTDLANELSLTKSNVHRLLATLITQGHVRQTPPQGHYELTTRLWELGNNVILRMDLTQIARPAMSRLAEQTGETVHLSMLDDSDVIYLDKIESDHPIRAHTRVGARAPAYTVATGKAMLARMPDDYLNRFDGRMTRYTDTTRTTLAELREDIRLVREQGCALVPEGEWREGIAACASAILNRSGDLAGAIGISGPVSRLKRKQLKEIAPQVLETARAISNALGYVPRC